MPDVEYFGRSQVGTISTPPLSQGETGGTSHVLNSAGRSRPRKGRVPGMAVSQTVSSPLNLEGTMDILSAAKLAVPKEVRMAPRNALNRAPESDEANNVLNRAPSNPTVTGNPGDPSNPHPLTSRMRDALSIRGGESGPTPLRTASLDDYSNLDYSPMTMPEMRQRMGLPPDLFGEG